VNFSQIPCARIQEELLQERKLGAMKRRHGVSGDADSLCDPHRSIFCTVHYLLNVHPIGVYI
jgi:hypothetical protein